jgi:hypothetical protein
VAAAVAAVLVVGTAVAATTRPDAPASSAGSGAAATTQPATQSTLVCPAVPAPSARTTARLSAAAPAGPGTLALGRLSAGDRPAALAAAPESPPAALPWLTTASSATRKGVLQLDASGATARSLAATALVRTTAGAARGLVGQACTPAGGDSWFVGGSGSTGRRDVLYLSNPEAADATVDVTVYAQGKDPQSPAPAQGVVVPAGGQRALPLDSLVPGAGELVVHVHTRSGRVAAALFDAYVSGTRSLGQDWVPPSAAPGRHLVVTGIPVETDARRVLTILAPGADDASVTVRLSTPEGTLSAEGLGLPETLPAGRPYLVDLAKAGVDPPYAVVVDSDVPVVAGVRTDRGAGSRLHDFSYAAATTPMAAATAVLALAVNDRATTSYLMVTADGDDDVTVRITDYDNAGKAHPVRTVTVAAGQTATVRAGVSLQSAPVVVERVGGGTAVLGWEVTESTSDGPLVTGGPVLQTPSVHPVTPVAPDPQAGLPPR